MKMGLVAVGIIIVIVLAAGAYYVVNSGSGSHGLITYNSTSTQHYSTIQYSSSIQPANATTQPTTTIKQNATTTVSASYTVNMASSQSLGTYLTNGSGYTLYYFGQDKANSGASNCNGGCASAWPPFYTATLNLPSGLSSSSFNTIIRGDGTKQLTYNGLPLYFFASDTKSGQVNGNNVGGFTVASTAPH